jgi:3',5'-cyclic AMP phosphodiesterase CpdA
MAILALVLMAPVTVLFVWNAIFAGQRTRHDCYPHDSGNAFGAVLTVFAAVIVLYMLVYSIVGLQSSFVESPIPTLLVVLGSISFFSWRRRGQHVSEVFELFQWAYLNFDRRIAAIWSAFILGTREAAVSFSQVVLTWLAWLGSTGCMLYVLGVYVLVPLLGHAPARGTARQLITSLLWMLMLFGVLIMVLAIRNFAKARKSKFGFKIPRIVGLSFDSSLAEAGEYRIAHLSDLHIPYGGRLTEEAEWRPEILDRCIAGLESANNAGPLAAVVVSGDVTDTGHQDAWTLFISKFASYKEKTILAPGNHDLNIVGYGVRSIFFVADEAHMAGRWKRMARYLDAASQVMGTRARVWTNGGLQPLPVAWNTLQNNGETLQIRQYSAAAKLFPFVVSVPDIGEHVKFIVWNTVRTSALAMNNSYGIIEKEQLANFENIAAYFSEKEEVTSYIHVMHHKLAFPAVRLHRHNKSTDACGVCAIVTGLVRGLKHRVQMAGMVMLNAGAVIESVAKGGSNVVLHGHHHASFWGQIKCSEITMHVVSAPSTTLGTETSDTGKHAGLGFDVLELKTAAGVCALASSPSRIEI